MIGSHSSYLNDHSSNKGMVIFQDRILVQRCKRVFGHPEKHIRVTRMVQIMANTTDQQGKFLNRTTTTHLKYINYNAMRSHTTIRTSTMSNRSMSRFKMQYRQCVNVNACSKLWYVIRRYICLTVMRKASSVFWLKKSAPIMSVTM